MTSSHYIKREPSTILGDYPTPGASIHSTPAIILKHEFEPIDLTADDDLPLTSFKSQATEDEGYASRMTDNTRDSSTPRASPRPSPYLTTSQSVPMAKPQGLEFVGQKVKLLVDAISDLRDFNLEHVVALPELVLVGDQSAGKSSLMSALTEVKLPRDQGMCTKCPANIKTSSASKWSCKISLQQEYDYAPTGGVIDEDTVSDRNPFPPWRKQNTEKKLFIQTNNKEDLENGIKWAQLALLNHNIDYHEFIPKTGSRARGDFAYEREIAEAKFSPNLIQVEISGPGLPALSFYDLPGIIRSTSNREDRYLVKEIENLAKKYIERPNALIIQTLAMKTDPSNSETSNIIARCQASERTIGVLTNPDHVAARHSEYEKVMQGRSHVVGHGYFVTKQPGEDSMISGPNYHEQARMEEMDYFDNNALWKGDWLPFRPRCGTRIIQTYLSQELAKLIQLSIPDIQLKIQRRTALVEKNLSECPPPPARDVRNVIARLLNDFSTDVKCVMNGDSIDSTTTLLSDWSNLADNFRDLILFIKPAITVNHQTDNIVEDVREVVTIDDDDDEEPFTPSRKRPGDPQHQNGPRKAARGNSVTPGPSTPRRIQTQQNGSPLKREAGLMPPPSSSGSPAQLKNSENPFYGTPFADYAHLGKRFANLEEIRHSIKKHGRPGSGLVSEKTNNELIFKANRKWEEPLDIFLSSTFDLVREQLQRILYNHLGKYEQTELYRAAVSKLDLFIDEHIVSQRKATTDLFKMERYRFFTVNRTAAAANEEHELEILRAARKKCRIKALVLHRMKSDQRKYPPDMPAEERTRIIKRKMEEVKDNELAPETFGQELQVAAHVRGYYLTAGIRFADNVCLSIYSGLFQTIRDSIFLYLEEKLDINSASKGDEICRKLMEEDSSIAIKRERLEQEKQRLTGFQTRLTNLVREINQPSEPEQENTTLLQNHNKISQHHEISFVSGSGSGTAFGDQREQDTRSDMPMGDVHPNEDQNSGSGNSEGMEWEQDPADHLNHLHRLNPSNMEEDTIHVEASPSSRKGKQKQEMNINQQQFTNPRFSRSTRRNPRAAMVEDERDVDF